MRILSFLCLLLFVPAGLADTVVLTSGLELYGTVTEKDGRVELTLDGKTRTFPADRVKEILRGETPYEEFSRRAAALEAGDGAGWYRLALWARERRVPRARAAFQKVLAADPDHRAARRELGYERVGEAWLTGGEAKRRKGFVLAGGKWLLPEEADRLMRQGLIPQAAATPAHHRRAREVVAALQDDDSEVRAVAADMLGELPDAAILRPLRKLLYAPHADTRVLAVKTLGRIGDRTALPWLIRTSMFDAQEEVRTAAVRAIRAFEDADVFYPYGRALFSKNPRTRIQAAKALGALGDERGVDLILRRISIGIGEAGRANFTAGTQNSYIQDFDVEIAQAAAIGDPIVQTIRDGVILDYKVLGGYGERWVVEQRNVFVTALRDITGRDFGTDWKAWRRYAEEQGYPRAKLTK